MASARLERTTVELTDGAGRAVLRATGQVVLFPGYLALYEEGRDEKAEDEEGARMPALREGDAPAQDRRRGDPAFHAAAAALFRGQPGEAPRRTRHRPALDLRVDPPDAEGPRICPASTRAASFPRRAAAW